MKKVCTECKMKPAIYKLVGKTADGKNAGEILYCCRDCIKKFDVKSKLQQN